MSIIKRNSNDVFNAPFFNDLFTRDLWDWGIGNNSNTGTTLPAVNIRETSENFVVEMAAPGMKKDDFTIQLDGNMLTITSEKKNEHEEKDGERYTRREFSYQSFQRSFQLPKDVVDEEHIQARYEDGVLHLVVPKKEEAKQKPPRMITVN